MGHLLSLNNPNILYSTDQSLWMMGAYPEDVEEEEA